jgi:predicted dehydrogenase
LGEIELAKDESVDLVVCTIRVTHHFAAIAPSLLAGKDVFVEWPLGKNLTEAKELLRLKNEGGVKNAIVGLQGRQSPFIKKIKSLVDGGRIGKVLSSTWSGQGTNLGHTNLERMSIVVSREDGGNLVTIHFGHAVDYVQSGKLPRFFLPSLCSKFILKCFIL